MRVDLTICVELDDEERRWIDACWDNLDILIDRLDYDVWGSAVFIRVFSDCAKISNYPLFNVDQIHLQLPPDDLVDWLRLYYPNMVVTETKRAAGIRTVLRDGTSDEQE